MNAMDVAETIAQNSKDPNTKVGAVILDEKNKVIGTGYNGMVQGVHEVGMWEQGREHKLHCVIHAEMNALLFSSRLDMTGCTMYCTHEPCENCLKHALQKGIRKFYFRIPYMKFSDAQKKAIYHLMMASGATMEKV